MLERSGDLEGFPLGQERERYRRGDVTDSLRSISKRKIYSSRHDGMSTRYGAKMRECGDADGVSGLVGAQSMRCRLGCAEGIVAAAGGWCRRDSALAC